MGGVESTVFDNAMMLPQMWHTMDCSRIDFTRHPACIY